MTEKTKRYMDFMDSGARGAKRVVFADPLANPPAGRVRRPKPSSTVSSRPASVSKTTFTSKETSSKSAPLKPSPKTSAAKAPLKPAVKSTPEKSLEKKPLKTASPAKDSDDLAKKAAAALSGSNLSASKYTLNGKSPFLPSYNVEKRPLSDSVKEPKVEEIPKKNVYKKEEKPAKAKKSKDPVVVIDQPKKSGLSGLILIILTIIIGAAIGAGAYFLLPK